jgi:hypothetical protein
MIVARTIAKNVIFRMVIVSWRLLLFCLLLIFSGSFCHFFEHENTENHKNNEDAIDASADNRLGQKSFFPMMANAAQPNNSKDETQNNQKRAQRAGDYFCDWRKLNTAAIYENACDDADNWCEQAGLSSLKREWLFG